MGRFKNTLIIGACQAGITILQIIKYPVAYGINIGLMWLLKLGGDWMFDQKHFGLFLLGCVMYFGVFYLLISMVVHFFRRFIMGIKAEEDFPPDEMKK